MGLLFVLKQQYLALAADEARAVVHGWRFWENEEEIVDGTIYFSRARKTPSSLSLTRKIVNVQKTVPRKNLKSEDLSLDITGSYAVRLTKNGYVGSERSIAKLIWKANNGTVDLDKPDTTIDVVLTKEEVYIGDRVWESEEEFEERRSHLLPAPHPSGMDPKIARALVNITCASTVHDPFCGAGGILIEGALAKKNISGADISEDMIKRARANCAHFSLAPELRIVDATSWLPRVQALICDLPYSKSTPKVNLLPLVDAFLERAKTSTRRVVIGVPQAIVVKGWHIRRRYDIYIHKEMVRYFYLLERVK